MAWPERAGDRDRYPRTSFRLSYVSHHGFAVDTEKGRVTQDRVVDPDTSIAFRLTEAQVDTLYEMALAFRLFEMRQPRDAAASWSGAADFGGKLIVQAGRGVNVLTWIPATDRDPWSEDYKRLTAFIEALTRMVQTSPQWRSLPPPRGGYL